MDKIQSKEFFGIYKSPMKAGCGNLKIPGDYFSHWRVMALVAQPKQVVLSNSSKTAQKIILVNEQMRYN